MKKNTVAKYLGLFILTFSLSMGLVIGLAGKAAACSPPDGCYVYYFNCPAASQCEGDPCWEFYSGNTLVGGGCCGFVTGYQCFH